MRHFVSETVRLDTSARQSLPANDPRRRVDGAARGANHLLDLLERHSPVEYRRLLPLLETVSLEIGDVLFEPGGPIPYVYFPAGCVASVVKITSDGKRVEVGTTGREGMAGIPAFLDAEATPLECFIQIAGAAARLPVDELRRVAAQGTLLHTLLQRYAQYLFDQAAQSVACNRLHTVSERCARWLLMTHDRVGSDRFELKQEFLATMLGVRRASVSEAADALQRAELIHYRRAKMTIVDRTGLEAAACECYASDRDDFARLLAMDSIVRDAALDGNASAMIGGAGTVAESSRRLGT